MTPEHVIEQRFWDWFRANHPFGRFTEEAGESLSHKYNVLVTEFARQAYTDAIKAETERCAGIASSYADMRTQLLRERNEARDKVKSAGKAVETLINHVNKVYIEMFK